MKAAVLATLAGSAVAFAPVQQATRTSTAVSATEAQRDFFGITGGADFSKELGVQPPVSFYCKRVHFLARKRIRFSAQIEYNTSIYIDMPYMYSLNSYSSHFSILCNTSYTYKQLGFFDPLGLLKHGSQETFDDLREKEIKHGRVAMLAVTGYLTTAAGIRFPGAEYIPDGLASWQALLDSADGQNVLYQMVAFVTVAEICNRDADWLDNKAEFVGDYRNGALDFGWDKFSDEMKLKKRATELNNGRAAMMGIWGLVTHEIMGVSILPGGYLPGH